MKQKLSEDMMALRASKEFQDGDVVNLGAGIPGLCATFVREGRNVMFESENGALGYGGIIKEDEFQGVEVQYIDAGESKLDLATFSLADLVREVIEEQGRLVEASKHKVQLVLPSGSSDVIADRATIRLVLTNLTSNAIRFTPAGGSISINVHQQGAEMWVSVRDNGPGIPERLRLKVFEPFYTGWKQAYGRAGMGLPLVQETVNQHGGLVDVNPACHEGCQIRVMFPLADGSCELGDGST